MEIDPNKLYWYISGSGMVEFQITGECVSDCSHSGQCFPEVEYWEKQLDWSNIDPDAIRSELREFGAWDDQELANDLDNRHRILWSAANDISESVFAGECHE